jgi:2-dehydro-3-deoxy-D-arabinonate dehydratase
MNAHVGEGCGLKLCRFEVRGEQRIGILEDNSVLDLTGSQCRTFSDIDTILSEAKEENMSLRGFIEKHAKNAQRLNLEECVLRIPLVPDEVWGAGITYLRSRDAREDETQSKGLYDHVYSAERPEIFLKGSGKRCVGPGEPIGIRGDSRWSVPEPELALVLGSDASVIGYTIANDVSARDIEGENPLYLPQAKIFQHCCAIGPVISLQDEIPNPHSLQIEMRILRVGKTVFEGQTSTSRMKRKIPELIRFLKADNVFFGCTVFMTGTGIVPPDDFTLKEGDVVEIQIEKIGMLENNVQKVSSV